MTTNCFLGEKNKCIYNMRKLYDSASLSPLKCFASNVNFSWRPVKGPFRRFYESLARLTGELVYGLVRLTEQ